MAEFLALEQRRCQRTSQLWRQHFKGEPTLVSDTAINQISGNNLLFIFF